MNHAVCNLGQPGKDEPMQVKVMLCLFVALLVGRAESLPREHSHPIVTIEYSELFDRAHAQAAKEPATEEAMQELKRRLPELRSAWESGGPVRLQETIKVVGKPLLFRETVATVIASRLPSMSSPLIINGRPYLNATAKEGAMPTTVFVQVVFHEVLHRYVRDLIAARPDAATPLLEKYSDETAHVRNHLHVAAIEILVARRLQRDDEYREYLKLEASLATAAGLARAKEIVQREGPEQFIDDLRGGTSAEGRK